MSENEVIPTKYPRNKIELTDEQKQLIQSILNNPNTAKRTAMHARILLESDAANTEHLTKEQLATKLGTTHTTIQFVRDRYHQSGFEAALYKNYSGGTSHWKLTPEITAQILELAKNKPEKHKKWSLRKLCEECKNRGIIDSVSCVTMMKLLNEHNIEL